MAVQKVTVIDKVELLHHTIDDDGMHIYFNVVKSHEEEIDTPEGAPPLPLEFPPYRVRRELHIGTKQTFCGVPIVEVSENTETPDGAR